MKRMWLATTLVICGLAQGLFGWQAALGDDDGATGAKMLPKDTLLYFSVPSIPETKAQFDKSVLGGLFRDPELQPFLDDVRKKIDELSDKLEAEVGVTINDLLALPQGELTFALMERPVRRLAPVLIVDYGDNKQTVETLLKKLHEGLEGEIAEHSTEDVEDTTVHVYTLKDEDPNNPFKTVAYVNEDSYLVFSTEVAAIKAVLERWEGDSTDTLADDDIYKYVQEKCKDESGDPDLEWFISPIGLIQSGLNVAQQFVPQAGMAVIFLPTLGLDRLKGWGGASYHGTDDFDEISRAFVYADQPKGVLDVFQFPVADLAPPKWVSAETSSYYCGNWNVSQAFLAIESMVDGLYGRGFTSKQLDQVADRDPEIHPKKDLIDLLDGKFHLIQSFESSEEGPPVQQFLLAFDLKDVEKMKKTLSKATAAAGEQVEQREFNGETIYEIAAGGVQTISVAVAVDHLVVTNEASMLEGMLRSETRAALVDSPAYKKIARHFPAKVSMLSFAHADAQLKPLYEMLKSSDNAEIVEGIDLQKLPPFEVIQKYLRPSGSYAVPDKKGALFVNFQLTEGDK